MLHTSDLTPELKFFSIGNTLSLSLLDCKVDIIISDHFYGAVTNFKSGKFQIICLFHQPVRPLRCVVYFKVANSYLVLSNCFLETHRLMGRIIRNWFMKSQGAINSDLSIY